jgi:hypothetical protein
MTSAINAVERRAEPYAAPMDLLSDSLAVKTAGAVASAALTYIGYKVAPRAYQKIQYMRALFQAPNEDVSSILRLLHRIAPTLINQRNFNALIATESNVHYSERNAYCFALALHDIDPTLVNQETFDALIESGSSAWNVVQEFHRLCKADPIFANQEILKVLSAGGGNSSHVSEALKLLRQVDPAFLNEVLISVGASAGPLAQALMSLQDLMNQKNATELLAIWRLRLAGLDQENLDKLFDKNADGTIEFLLRDGDVLPSPLTQASFDDFILSLLDRKYKPDAPAALAAINRALTEAMLNLDLECLFN